MANSNNSLITGKFRGSLGKQLVFRDWAGKTIVAKSPASRKGAPTAAQEETLQKFQLASRYAKAILQNPDQSLAQAYANALKPRQNVYSRAMEDFLSSPVVKSIDTRNYTGAEGDTIIVRALDDFRVTNVRVEIRDSTGALVDTGNAVQNTNGIDWTFTAAAGNTMFPGSTIKAIATDVPRNEGTLEVTVM